MNVKKNYVAHITEWPLLKSDLLSSVPAETISAFFGEILVWFSNTCIRNSIIVLTEMQT